MTIYEQRFYDHQIPTIMRAVSATKENSTEIKSELQRLNDNIEKLIALLEKDII